MAGVEKICAGIVLFHPDTDRLRQCIDAVSGQAEELILVNNAPEDEQILKETFSSDKTVWICNDRNMGIATALNQLLTHADNSGYKWLLTLDQDSICSEGFVDKLLDAANNDSRAAMISPLVVEHGVVWEDRKPKRKKSTAGNSAASGSGSEIWADVEEIPFCITSGTLTDVKAVLSIGGFDERLFIDEVDRDICIRLRYSGYRVLRVNTAQIQHEFGTRLVYRRILFKVYRYRNYSPFRVYYQMRNMVYMVRKYGADYKPCPAWRLIRPFFTFAVKFIFEPQRLKRLSAFIRGYAAGWKMKK